MREIKFRVWSKEGEQMMSWDELLKAPDLDSFMQNPNENGYYSNTMQFTGLCDKDGKDIYEGDIVKFTYRGGQREKLSIGYSAKSARFQAFGKSGVGYGFDDSNDMGVIGNIYENPELLEVAK